MNIQKEIIEPVLTSSCNEKNSRVVWNASFDIGKKNFAFCVEETCVSQLTKLNYVSKNQRYNIDGTATEPFGKVLREVCVNGKLVLFKNIDLTTGCKNGGRGDKGCLLNPEVFYTMIDVLDEYKQYWDRCDNFVIEQQMKTNMAAVKLAQNCFAYFAVNYGRFKSVIEFPAYYKTQILGSAKMEITNPKTGKKRYKCIDKAARKKWSVDKAIWILSEREDFETVGTLVSRRKKDDLADVVCQLQSWKYLFYVDKSIVV